MANPPAVRPATILKTFELLAHVAAVVTLILLLLQFRVDLAQRREQAHAETVRQAIEFVQRYGDEPMATYRRTAQLPFVEIREQLERQNAGGGMAREEIDQMVSAMVAGYDKRHPEAPAALAIQEIVGFFDLLKICVEQAVCDRKTIISYFRADAVSFSCTYSAVIASLEGTNPTGFGEGLKWLAGKAGCSR